MKLTKILLTLTLVLAVAFTFVGCEDLTAAIEDATAPLKESIAELEAVKTELETAKATLETAKAELEAAKEKLEAEKAKLEADKATLEAEKAELNATVAELETKINCLEGNHVWDGESSIEYDWNGAKTECIAIFPCAECDSYGSALSLEVTEQDGLYTATFDNGIPSNTTDGIDWIVVTTEDELISAVNRGGAVIFGADITCVTEGLYVMNNMLINMNGYDLTVTADGYSTVAVYDSTVEIFSSVDGSELIGSNGIDVNTSEGKLTVRNVEVVADGEYSDVEVMGCVDISEMIFDEIYVYVYEGALEFIIPDGYAIYRGDGSLIETLDEAIETGHVYVKPVQE